MMKKRLFALSFLCIMSSLNGCVYLNNYDENGNKMNKTQVREALESLKEDIEIEINNAISNEQ